MSIVLSLEELVNFQQPAMRLSNGKLQTLKIFLTHANTFIFCGSFYFY